MSKILCSLIADFVLVEIKCGECLCVILNEVENKMVTMLLYFVLEHWQDIVQLDHQFCCVRGQLSLVSV